MPNSFIGRFPTIAYPQSHLAFRIQCERPELAEFNKALDGFDRQVCAAENDKNLMYCSPSEPGADIGICIVYETEDRGNGNIAFDAKAASVGSPASVVSGSASMEEKGTDGAWTTTGLEFATSNRGNLLIQEAQTKEGKLPTGTTLVEYDPHNQVADVWLFSSKIN